MPHTPEIDQALKSAKQKGLISKHKATPIMSSPSKNTPKDPDHPTIQTLNGIVTALTFLLLILLAVSAALYLRNQTPLTQLPY